MDDGDISWQLKVNHWRIEYIHKIQYPKAKAFHCQRKLAFSCCFILPSFAEDISFRVLNLVKKDMIFQQTFDVGVLALACAS